MQMQRAHRTHYMGNPTLLLLLLTAVGVGRFGNAKKRMEELTVSGGIGSRLGGIINSEKVRSRKAEPGRSSSSRDGSGSRY